MTPVAALSGWDPAQPSLAQLLGRLWIFATSTRLRRFTVAPLLLQAVFSLAVLAFPAEAQALTQARDPILAFLGVKDGYGVPVSNYLFSTDYGTVFDLGTHAVMGTILTTQASLFVLLGGAAIWLVINVLNFNLLRILVTPVAEVLQSYGAAVLPGVFAIAATITALIVAFNVMKGNAPRAASQTAAALVVALLFGAFAYGPIGWTISESGPLAQGRNVAVALGANSAAGVDNTADTLQRLEGTWSTMFVRRPLQVWNFGAQVDDTPGCASAWSAGVLSGDPDRVKDGVRDCGSPDSASMKAHADNPSPAQIGSGFGFLAFMGLFVVFCFTLAYRIVSEFFYALVQAVRLMVNLAIGVIPGPTQASLAGSLVAVLLGFVAMFTYITVTILFGEIVGRVFVTQNNSIVALFSCIVLMMVAMRIMSRVPNALRQIGNNVSASVMSSVGGPSPSPAPPVPNTGAGLVGAAVGAGATLGGQRLAQHAPGAARALNIVAPMVNSRAVRAANRGTHLAYTYTGMPSTKEPKDSPPDQPTTATASNAPDTGQSQPPPTGGPDQPPPPTNGQAAPAPAAGDPSPTAAPATTTTVVAPPAAAPASGPERPPLPPPPSPPPAPQPAPPAAPAPPTAPSDGSRRPATTIAPEMPPEHRPTQDIPSPQVNPADAARPAPPPPTAAPESAPAPAPASPFTTTPTPPPAPPPEPRPGPRTSPERPLPPPPEERR